MATLSTSQAMQTSVRQMTPRLVDSTKHPTCLTTENGKNPMTTWYYEGEMPMESTLVHHGNRHEIHGGIGDSAPAPFSQVKPPYSRDSCAKDLYAVTTAQMARLERDRQSVKELAAFLANNEPPADNWISIPDSEGLSDTYRRYPFRILHKLNRKRSTASPRLLKLPDSAVAAKTSSGNLHIAISIPIEYDHQECTAPVLKRLPQASTSNYDHSSDQYTGPITILKPISEESDRVAGRFEHSGTLQNVKVSSDPILGQEATRTLQNYYRLESLRERKSRESSTTTNCPGTERPNQDSSLAASSSEISRQSSQRTDPRHSGGTAYSERSFDTNGNHSRGPSSVSTPPSTGQPLFTSITIDPPQRSSSMSKRGDSTSTDHGRSLLAKIEDPGEGPSAQYLVKQSRRSKHGIGNSKSDISSNRMVVENVEYTHDPSEVVVRIRQAPRTPAPNRALPELPGGSDDGQSARSRANIFGARSTSHIISPVRSKDADGLLSPYQSRQERVKALKLRDIATLRAKQTGNSGHAKANQTGILEPSPMSKARPTGAARQVRRRSQLSLPGQNEGMKRRASSVISPIMLVADLEPYSGFYHSNDLIFPIPPSSLIDESTRLDTVDSSCAKSHTPPRTMTPSLASSDEESVLVTKQKVPRSSPSRSNRSKANENRLHRGIRPDVTSQEDLVDVRLRRLEDTHTMLLQTLEAVGLGFKELNRLMSLNISNSIDGQVHKTDGVLSE